MNISKRDVSWQAEITVSREAADEWLPVLRASGRGRSFTPDGLTFLFQGAPSSRWSITRIYAENTETSKSWDGLTDAPGWISGIVAEILPTLPRIQAWLP